MPTLNVLTTHANKFEVKTFAMTPMLSRLYLKYLIFDVLLFTKKAITMKDMPTVKAAPKMNKFKGTGRSYLSPKP